jgi:ribosomal protein S18 acetylase RimI-like enzyme
MTVRVACMGDISQMEVVDRAVYGDPLSRSQMSGICAHPASAVFVAEDEDAVVGYILAYTDSCAAEIMRIAVHPDHRRLGHGRELVSRLAEMIGEDMSIEIKVAPDKGLASWLHACEFQKVESHKNHDLYRRGWRFSRAPMLKFRMH